MMGHGLLVATVSSDTPELKCQILHSGPLTRYDVSVRLSVRLGMDRGMDGGMDRGMDVIGLEFFYIHMRTFLSLSVFKN